MNAKVKDIHAVNMQIASMVLEVLTVSVGLAIQGMDVYVHQKLTYNVRNYCNILFFNEIC